MRQAGKYGRRTPKKAKAIRFSDIWTGAISLYPPYVDYLARLDGGWNMLGNDAAGDCVAVTWANFRRLVTGTLTNTTVYPTQSQVWQFYETQNNGFDPAGSSTTNGPGSSDDSGMDIQTALEDLHQNGGPDGAKLVFFASVNVKNPVEVKAAIAACGALWTGINVYDNNQSEFAAELPWQFVPGTALDGGHSILTGGFGTTVGLPSVLSGDEKFITWAAETSFTDNFWANGTEEAWACIWPEQLGTRSFQLGVDKQLLAQAYKQTTGQAIAIP